MLNHFVKNEEYKKQFTKIFQLVLTSHKMNFDFSISVFDGDMDY